MLIKHGRTPIQTWYDLPYLATDDAIDAVLDRWLGEWHTTSYLVMGASKTSAQCKKVEAKLKMVKLAKKRKKEATNKAQVEHDAA